MSNVTLPYSVNGINGHSASYSKGTYQFTTTINLHTAQPTYLWFQHADQSADIYVDNEKVTTHWGGYGAFFTDISNYVHAGENTIKVVLCNTTRNTLAPCSADFNFNATLGKVKVLSSPVLPAMLYGYDGFHITATNVSSAAATLTIRTNIPAGGSVICKIDDDDSNYHYYAKQETTGSEISFTTTINNPHLWNGKLDPHLYNVTLEVYKDGDLYHKFERGYGIRYYSYVYNHTLPNNETYTGFLLNGSPYLLRGVCMHDDLEFKANALDDNDYAQEFAVIQEVGCNFIRLAHYPHPKEVYDWCDRLGIIVQTEVPLVNNIRSTQPADYYTHLEGQYIDMVTQHYNHPCIMFWGLGNEFNAQMDDASFACTKLEHYRDIIKTYDTERMVGCVLNASSSNPRNTVGGADLDWYGCNIYVGWYSNTNSNNPTSQLNQRLNNVTDRPIAYSEYGCGGTQHCHSDDFMATTTRGNHERHDIEYQMWLHEGQIAAIKNFPQLLFTSEWQFFDIAVSGRNEGYTVCLDGENSYIDDELRRLNNKGLVERDHRTKKDTFYLYKAWWNQTDKFVHICGKDYEKFENRVIKCYTNDGSSLKLYVNDVLKETVSVTNNIATFTERDFNPGDEIKVTGDNTNDILNVIDYNAEYLTFDILSDGNITWKCDSSAPIRTISYSKNNGDWTSITSTTNGVSIPVNKGDKVRFKGSNSAYSSYTTKNNILGGTATFNVYGNIMSLIGGDNFSNLTTLSSAYTFCRLFAGCGVKSAKNLKLPVTTLVSSCYSYMFFYCTNLITAPELPATTLASNCYYSMFEDCASLITAPELPATTMEDSCYQHMFAGCTSLTTTPSLPATTLENECYQCMFGNCTSLTTAPELPATTLATYCYGSMFIGCTSLTTAPELPATTLASNCYYYMFYGCTSLNYIKCLAINNSATGCTSGWVNGVAATGTFVKNPGMSSWTTGISGIPTGWTVENYKTYLTFDIKSNGTITWTASDSSNTKTISYSTDDGSTWTNITSSTSGASINVSAGDKVMFKGTNNTYARSSLSYNSFNGTSSFNVSGNIMSLIGGDNFSNSTTLSKLYTFSNLFRDCTGLIYAKNLILPATTLAQHCYNSMFSGCTSLTTAPELPATTLTDGCYTDMFLHCTSLTTAPELPATTLANRCYDNMFSGCNSLTTAPELPATTLAQYCYSYMFYGCTGLTIAPELPATTLANTCYRGMFYGCTSLTTAPELPATTLADFCYYEMFRGCTSLETAPELPATTLTDNCYQSMFSGCTNLTAAPELPATTLTNACYSGMFWGCFSLTTAPELPATTLADYCYYEMFNVCTNLNYIKCFATDISAIDCTSNWVNGVAATGTFMKDSLMTSWTTGTSGIPSGWTVDANYEFAYLTFDVISGGTISWTANDSSYTKTISYSTDNGSTWTNITSSTSGTSINVSAGDMVLFKGDNSAYGGSNTYYNYFGGTATFDVKGNIMSLVDSTGFRTITTLTSDYIFKNLFDGCSGLISAENLVLPATTLTNSCYYSMFSGCTGLTTAPELPATTLSNSCYRDMFSGCTGLTTAPVLPATTLAERCYRDMFSGCTSLTTAPELPATTLATECYLAMFSGCTSLTTTPVLPVTTLADYCYYQMFRGCTSLTTAPALPATTLTTSCYYGMFARCTSLTTAPELPATTLATECYRYMLYGCTSLTTAPALPATTLADGCYGDMFSSCTSLTTAPVLPATTLKIYCYYDMFYGCTSLNYIKCLATDISATSCTDDWVYGVAATGTFVKNPEMSSWTTGISGIPTGWTVVEDYDSSYLTFNIEANGNIYWRSNNSNKYAISYSKNNGGWTNLNAGSSVSVVSGDKLRFKGTNTTYGSSSYAYHYFSSYCKFNVSGNIMSLIYGDNFVGKTSLSSNYTFTSLFNSCRYLTSAEHLVLPATTLANNCYSSMFEGCTSLTTAPELPATTLASYCYYEMFSGCNKLTTAPVLPATTVADDCYYYMFYGCTSLTTAPALPATTLAGYCYYGMFCGCTGLINIPSTLPATTLAKNCYYQMFQDCTKITSTPTLPATTLADYCYHYMFKGCTGLTNIPSILPATTLAINCYNSMFSGCTSLTTTPTLPATTLENSCYSSMFSGCTSLTTTPTLPATTLSNSCYVAMFQGCTKITSTPALPATTLANNCYSSMFKGCTSLTTVPELPATTLAEDCYAHMFDGCIILTTSPELPATTLVNGCYSYMFNGCTCLVTAPVLPATTLVEDCYWYMFYNCSSLNYIECLATDISATKCTSGWVNGVAATGTFVKNPGMSSWTTGISGIPTGWIVNDTYDNQYLTFDVKSNGNITWKSNNSDSQRTISYSKNGGSWTDITSTTSGTEISVTTGDKVRFKTFDLTNSNGYFNCFGGTATFDVYGNIMSLMGGDDFKDLKSMQSRSFMRLFYNCTGLLSAENLILPATTLSDNCYESMFCGCTNLVTASELPATTLTNSCYIYMFYGCTSLTMAPILPAQTLTSNCYNSMFYGCTNLNYIKCLATDKSANGCTSGWVEDVSATGTFVKDPEMSSWTTGISGIPTGWTTEVDYLNQYLTFDIKSNGNITWKASKNSSQKTISYSKNGGSWTDITSTTSGVDISVVTGDKVRFKGSNGSYSSSDTYYSYFTSTSTFDTYGNIMSMINGDNFANATTLPLTYALSYLFYNCTRLLSAENLILPATILTKYCYQYMFYSCSNLTSVPELPATTLANYCYYRMFCGCTSLTTVQSILPATTLANYCYQGMYSGSGLTTTPALPATTLTIGCYKYMFSGCNNLTTTPTLPATTLASYCYQYMFSNCTALTSVSELPATTLASYCYQYMFYYCYNLINASLTLPATTLASYCYSRMFEGCSKLTSTPTLPATTLAPYCYEYMFYDCHVLTTTPTLPATTLANYCYQYMFGRCYALTNVSTLPATTLAEDCYSGMFGYCSSLTTTPVLPATTLANSCYSNMFHDCTSLTTAPTLPATTLADNCYNNMFSDCTSLTTAPVLPATTVINRCYCAMFYGCTSLVTAPVLPATTLATECYYSMFNGCTNLNYIKCLATDISATDCTKTWVSNVAASGTFVKDSSMTSWNTGITGIPTGWTVEDAS